MGRPTALTMDGRPAMAGRTSATRNDPVQHHSISGTDTSDLRAYLQYDSGALMAHDQRTLPPQRGVIGVAEAGGPDLDEDLVALRRGHLDGLDAELALAGGDGRSGRSDHVRKYRNRGTTQRDCLRSHSNKAGSL